jgi:hypothetical protein
VGVSVPDHVELRCFPSHDEQFIEHVYVVASRMASSGVPLTCSALQERIRTRYPHASVHARAELATLMPGEPAWYVYRDGGI